MGNLRTREGGFAPFVSATAAFAASQPANPCASGAAAPLRTTPDASVAHRPRCVPLIAHFPAPPVAMAPALAARHPPPPCARRFFARRHGSDAHRRGGAAHVTRISIARWLSRGWPGAVVPSARASLRRFHCDIHLSFGSTVRSLARPALCIVCTHQLPFLLSTLARYLVAIPQTRKTRCSPLSSLPAQRRSIWLCQHHLFCSPSCWRARCGSSSLAKTQGFHLGPRAGLSSAITARSRAKVHGISSATWGETMVSLRAHSAIHSPPEVLIMMALSERTTWHRRGVQHPRPRPPRDHLQLLRPRRRPLQQALQ